RCHAWQTRSRGAWRSFDCCRLRKARSEPPAAASCTTPFKTKPRRESIVGDDLMAAVLAGGYPEALGRKTLSRRWDWYADYIQAIVQRNVRDVAQIEQIAQMPRLLRILAEHSGQLVNYSGIGAAIGMNHITTQKYVGIFESLFLARTV